jgi:hypothetical protein
VLAKGIGVNLVDILAIKQVPGRTVTNSISSPLATLGIYQYDNSYLILISRKGLKKLETGLSKEDSSIHTWLFVHEKHMARSFEELVAAMEMLGGVRRAADTQYLNNKELFMRRRWAEVRTFCSEASNGILLSNELATIAGKIALDKSRTKAEVDLANAVLSSYNERSAIARDMADEMNGRVFVEEMLPKGVRTPPFIEPSILYPTETLTEKPKGKKQKKCEKTKKINSELYSSSFKVLPVKDSCRGKSQELASTITNLQTSKSFEIKLAWLDEIVTYDLNLSKCRKLNWDISHELEVCDRIFTDEHTQPKRRKRSPDKPKEIQISITEEGNKPSSDT